MLVTCYYTIKIQCVAINHKEHEYDFFVITLTSTLNSFKQVLKRPEFKSDGKFGCK